MAKGFYPNKAKLGGNPAKLHDTMKGDHHKDKPFGEYKAVSKASAPFAGVFGGEGGGVTQPAFRKPLSHSHGSTPNKAKVRG